MNLNLILKLVSLKTDSDFGKRYFVSLFIMSNFEFSAIQRFQNQPYLLLQCRFMSKHNFALVFSCSCCLVPDPRRFHFIAAVSCDLNDSRPNPHLRRQEIHRTDICTILKESSRYLLEIACWISMLVLFSFFGKSPEIWKFTIASCTAVLI